MKLFVVPIERIELRYSSQWRDWFENYLGNSNIDYEFIDGYVLTNKIETGSFLDVYSTNYYKASQLKEIIDKIYSGIIDNNSVILFLDMWFPGIEMLQYIRQGANLSFKIAGLLHAGTYDEFDFLSKTGMSSWGKHLENSWFDFIDKIFVATNFHKRLIINKRNVKKDKISVTGFPIYPCRVENIEKENIVVFPHRLDSEKKPDKFDYLERYFEQKKNWKFVKTMSCYTSKEEYYKLLSKSKVSISFAMQETWGIAMQESLFCGCIPVVPDRLSYTEMYEPIFRYTSNVSALDMVECFMSFNDIKREELIKHNRENLLDIGKNAIKNIISEALNL